MNGRRNRWPALTWLLLWIAGTIQVLPHRLDECLQAALVEIKPGEIRLQINMNPGAQVADPVIWLIDRDHDGTITRAEGDSYAKAFLTRLSLALDDKVLKLEFLEASFDAVPELQKGTGNIRVNSRATFRGLRRGQHVISFENRHLPELSVYLLNAVLPKTPAIRIVKQERNENQSSGKVHFALEPSVSGE